MWIFKSWIFYFLPAFFVTSKCKIVLKIKKEKKKSICRNCTQLLLKKSSPKLRNPRKSIRNSIKSFTNFGNKAICKFQKNPSRIRQNFHPKQQIQIFFFLKKIKVKGKKRRRKRAYVSSLTARLRRASKADSLDSGESRSRSMETRGWTESERSRRHLWEVLVRRRISRAPWSLESRSSDCTRCSARWTAEDEDEGEGVSASVIVSVVEVEWWLGFGEDEEEEEEEQ